MKFVLWILAAIVSANAFADSGPQEAKNWIGDTIGNENSKVIKGKTFDGLECELDLDYVNGEYQIYLYRHGVHFTDSISVSTRYPTRTTYHPSYIRFDAGDNGDMQSLALQLDDTGAVVQVYGIDTFRAIGCNLK